MGRFSFSYIDIIFSTHALDDSYQESYQSYEIVDYKTVNVSYNTDPTKKCGYRFYSRYCENSSPHWNAYTAGSNGNYYDTLQTTSEQRCNCPSKYGPYDYSEGMYVFKSTYTSVCVVRTYMDLRNYGSYYTSSAANWILNNTCPKGWGPTAANSNNFTKPFVTAARGWKVTTKQEPVYGYVTRYRDVYYNYIANRVAKF